MSQAARVGASVTSVSTGGPLPDDGRPASRSRPDVAVVRVAGSRPAASPGRQVDGGATAGSCSRLVDGNVVQVPSLGVDDRRLGNWDHGALLESGVPGREDESAAPLDTLHDVGAGGGPESSAPGRRPWTASSRRTFRDGVTSR
jgi:hypothetical protein